MLYTFEEFAEVAGDGREFDVCIAGAGVAGIVLANELGRSNKQVLLLEGGDVEFTEESQTLYEGEVVGMDYFDLDTARLRFLGGTSNHWSGWCRPLDDVDFEPKSYLDWSGWPISRGDLERYLEKACEILEIEYPFPTDVAVNQSDRNLRQITYRFSPPVNFRDKYFGELKGSENISLVLNANVFDIRLETGSGTVTSFSVLDYGDASKVLDGKATHFVLALGGIENPRALLNANSQIEAGIGNGHDLVGRFFMEHPHFDVGWMVLNRKGLPFGGETAFFGVGRRLMEARRTLNCELQVHPHLKQRSLSQDMKQRIKNMICESETALDLVELVFEDFKQAKCRLSRRKMKNVDPSQFDGFIRAAAEQAPNPQSRVLLSDERDRFELRKVKLDWNLLEVDKATLRESVLELGRYFARSEIGRIRVSEWLLENDARFPGFEDGEKLGGFHHMGTTRMGASEKDGVVDRHGRVFGLKNLYIGGSSVFPTGGHVPPTLSIVQLALRLSNHLQALS